MPSQCMYTLCVVLFVVDNFYVFSPGYDVAISLVAKCCHKAYRDHTLFQDELFCRYPLALYNKHVL